MLSLATIISPCHAWIGPRQRITTHWVSHSAQAYCLLQLYTSDLPHLQPYCRQECRCCYIFNELKWQKQKLIQRGRIKLRSHSESVTFIIFSLLKEHVVYQECGANESSFAANIEVHGKPRNWKSDLFSQIWNMCVLTFRWPWIQYIYNVYGSTFRWPQ